MLANNYQAKYRQVQQLSQTIRLLAAEVEQEAASAAAVDGPDSGSEADEPKKHSTTKHTRQLEQQPVSKPIDPDAIEPLYLLESVLGGGLTMAKVGGKLVKLTITKLLDLVKEKAANQNQQLNKEPTVGLPESVSKIEQLELQLSASEDKGLWSKTKDLSSIENAYKHWKNHKDEFLELKNSKEYVEFAKKFSSAPPKNTLQKICPNGDKLLYNQENNIFVVIKSDGTIRTIFKPITRIEYWNNLK